MRKILGSSFAIVSLLLLLLSSPSFALDYDNALRTAKNENKPLLLYFYSNTCYYCNVMDKDTLADNGVSATLRHDFVFLRIDVDRSKDLARLYRITGTPSSWFLEPSGKRLFEAPGYVQKSDYKTILEYVKGKYYDSMDLMAYMKKASNHR
jgi:thioredoxin-related protein